MKSNSSITKMDGYLREIFFFVLFAGTRSQLTTRQCSANSTVVDSRCAATSDLQAVNACTAFCASTTQTSTALYTKYCSSPSSCVVGSACNIESCNIDITGPTSIEVPCSYTDTLVGSVTLTNGCNSDTSKNYVTSDLIFSSNNDGAKLISVDPTTGEIKTVSDPLVTDNVTQIYEFTFSSLPNLEVSKSINVTFHFGACVFTLVGPSSAVVCPGYPPGTNPGAAGAGGTEPPPIYDAYPQLTFTALNVPPLMRLSWDLATDLGGLGAPSGPAGPVGSPPGQNWGLSSPAIISGDDPNVFISNMNAAELANIPAERPIGIYGAGNNGDLPCSTSGVTNAITGTDPLTGDVTGNCCQTLLFSVSPGFGTTPFQTGSKQVKVCYLDPATCNPLDNA